MKVILIVVCCLIACGTLFFSVRIFLRVKSERDAEQELFFSAHKPAKEIEVFARGFDPKHATPEVIVAFRQRVETLKTTLNNPRFPDFERKRLGGLVNEEIEIARRKLIATEEAATLATILDGLEIP